MITDRFTLTAAHCVANNLVSVRLGEHNINVNNSEECIMENYLLDLKTCLDPFQEIDIEKKIRHPHYSKGQNDIALIQLKTPANLNANNVKRICLPLHEHVQIENTVKTMKYFVILGCGVNEANTKSNVLMKAYVPFMNMTNCKAAINELGIDFPFERTNICAGGEGVKKIDTVSC